MRNAVATLLSLALFTVAGARAALMAQDALWIGATWGLVVGFFVAYGERRRDQKGRDRSGVIGSTVDKPPERSIIRL